MIITQFTEPMLHARHSAQNLTFLISFNYHNNPVLLLQKEKSRLGDIKQHAEIAQITTIRVEI